MFLPYRKSKRLTENGISTLQSVALTAVVVLVLIGSITFLQSNLLALQGEYSKGIENSRNCFENDPGCKLPDSISDNSQPGVTDIGKVGGGGIASKNIFQRAIDWFLGIPDAIAGWFRGNDKSASTSNSTKTASDSIDNRLRQKPNTTFGDLLNQGVPAPSNQSAPAPSSQGNANTSKQDAIPKPISLDVPLSNQNESGKWNTDEKVACGPTSIKMILDYYHGQDSNNKASTLQEIIQKLKNDKKWHDGFGTYESDLKTLVEAEGFSAEYKSISKVDDLKAIIRDGNPLMVPVTINMQARKYDKEGNIKNGHFMVVVGVSEDGKQVTVNDPNGGVQTNYSYDDFSSALQGSGLLIKPKK